MDLLILLGRPNRRVLRGVGLTCLVVFAGLVVLELLIDRRSEPKATFSGGKEDRTPYPESRAASPEIATARVDSSRYLDTGVIAGRVTDTDRRAVAGAVVALDDGIADALIPRETATTITDENGLFELAAGRTRAESDPVRFVVRAEGFETHSANAHCGARDVSVVLRELTIRCLRIDFEFGSEPVPKEVRVFVASTGAFSRNYGFPVQEFALRTDGDGSVFVRGLTPDAADVAVHADGFVPALAERIGLVGTTPRRPARTSVTLSKGASVFGLVRFVGDLAPVPALRVAAWPATDGPFAAAPRALDDVGARPPVSSMGLLAKLAVQTVPVDERRAESQFVLNGLAPGSYRVAVIGPDSLIRALPVTAAVPPATAVGPVVFEVETGVSLTVRATFEGRPFPISAFARPSRRGSFGQYGRVTGEGTRFDGLPPGPMLVEIRPVDGLTGRRYRALTRLPGLLSHLFGGESDRLRFVVERESIQFDVPFDDRIEAFAEYLEMTDSTVVEPSMVEAREKGWVVSPRTFDGPFADALAQWIVIRRCCEGGLRLDPSDVPIEFSQAAAKGDLRAAMRALCAP